MEGHPAMHTIPTPLTVDGGSTVTRRTPTENVRHRSVKCFPPVAHRFPDTRACRIKTGGSEDAGRRTSRPMDPKLVREGAIVLAGVRSDLRVVGPENMVTQDAPQGVFAAAIPAA